MARPISAANQLGRFDALWTGRMIVYEVRYQQGKWVVTYKDAVLFSFDDRNEAIARLDDVAYAGARLRNDVEIRIYDEKGELEQRYSGLDFEI
jgi:hypothetical protein